MIDVFGTMANVVDYAGFSFMEYVWTNKHIHAMTMNDEIQMQKCKNMLAKLRKEKKICKGC